MNGQDESPWQESEHDHDSGEEEFFLEDEDIIQEITIDEEDLPQQDDDLDSYDADDSIYVFKGHTGELYTVACSPTDKFLVATGGGENIGYLWKIDSADLFLQLQVHEDSVTALAFSFDGRYLACGSFDGLVQVWDTCLGSFQCMLEGSGGIEWLKWHPKEHLILAGTEDSNVLIWDAKTNFTMKMFFGHGSNVTCGDFTPDGKYICTGSNDGSLMIRTLRTETNIHVKGYPHRTEGLTCLAITSDSTVAIIGSKDSSIHVVNIETGKVIGPLSTHSESVECIGISQSYNWAASGGMDGKLIIWDVCRLSARCTCEHDEGVTCLLWLGESPYVATGCVDGKVRVWDARSGSCVRMLNGHNDVIQSLAISADKNYLVSASLDHSARVFSVSEFR